MMFGYDRFMHAQKLTPPTMGLLSAEAVAALEVGMGEQDMVFMNLEFARGSHIAPHHHEFGQLNFAKRGVMTVRTRSGTWVVPPSRAVWIPPQVEHEILPFRAEVSQRNVLIAPPLSGRLPQRCCVLNVAPFLRELILRAAENQAWCERGRRGEMLQALLLDELQESDVLPVYLPEPVDGRLRRICSALRDNPADDRTLEEWATIAGASSRTLARLFFRETGLTFAHWRRQVRLMEALVRLSLGQQVTTVALDLGYESPSSFIEMFRRAMGTTPGQYFS